MTVRAAPPPRNTPTPPGDSPFELLAYAFLPAERGRPGLVLEAPPDWRFAAADLVDEADVVVWGRTPGAPAPLVLTARRAALRELSLRTLRRRLGERLRLVAVHRLPPRGLRMDRLRRSVRAALRGGALVELSAAPKRSRVLDAVAEAAGVRPSERSIHGGAGGVVILRGAVGDGSPAVLRVAREGAPGDPAALADALARLGASVGLAPRLHARGVTAGASWAVEEALPGRRPSRVDASLVREVTDACASFPRDEGHPTATTADLDAVAAILPERAAALASLASELSGTFPSLPAILRHGDLWTGNLLVDRAGRLSGIVDWDAAHPAGVPGADLLQLVATDLRRAAGLALGPAFLTRPWRSREFEQAAARYWPALGVAPGDEVLEAAGVAWWAAEVYGTLARLPHRAADERWLETNVDRVLARLER